MTSFQSSESVCGKLTFRVGVSAVGPSEAVRLMNGGAILIDVRGSEAFAAGHIANARSVPGATIADGAQALERFKEKTVIAYCDSGHTSAIAVRTSPKSIWRRTICSKGAARRVLRSTNAINAPALIETGLVSEM